MKITKIWATTFILATNLPFEIHAEDSKFYVGAGIGNSSVSFNSNDFGTQEPNADRKSATKDTIYKIFAGYDFNKIFGVEYGYADQGAFNFRVNPNQGYYTGDVFAFKYRADSLFIDSKVSAMISEKFNIFGKVGLDLNRVQNTSSLDSSHHIEPPLLPGTVIGNYANSSVFSTQGGNTSYRVNRLFGAGTEVKATAHTAVRLEFEDYGEFGNQNTTGRARISNYTLSFVYSP